MTETIDAETIRTMPPDALRRWLAETGLGLSYDQSEADYRYDPNGPVWWYTIRQNGVACGTFMISGHIEPRQVYVWTRVYAELKIPDWPSDLAAAWSLVLEHCVDPDGHATFQIFTLPDGRVEVFDGRATALSSLRQMKDYEVTSYPGLTGPVALADGLARLCALAIREKEVEE